MVILLDVAVQHRSLLPVTLEDLAEIRNLPQTPRTQRSESFKYAFLEMETLHSVNATIRFRRVAVDGAGICQSGRVSENARPMV